MMKHSRDVPTDELAQRLWDYNALQQTVKKSDAVLVLGSNDVRIASRAADLFLQGYAPLVIFSGNVGRLSQGLWNRPEAEIFAQEAMKLGVPEENILIENRSKNTGENILFTKELLEKLGKQVQSFILVQKPYMLRRSWATFKKVWPEKEVCVTSVDIPYASYANALLSKDHIINVMIGDTQRIKIYPAKGFQIPQDIPKDVWAAYEELVRRGFNTHLIEE